MKLSLSNLIAKKEKAEYYLGLLLSNEKAQAIIFEKNQENLRIISEGKEYFPQSIEDATFEIIIKTVNLALSKAEEILPQNIKVHKTIFSLKKSWVTEDKIQKDYLDKLKKLSGDLDLIPIGFLVNYEAVANLLQKKEGAPFSGILADIGQKFITAVLIKAGKILEVKTVEITDDYPNVVDTLIKHFEKAEILSPRILLMTDPYQDLMQQFISHQWSKSIPFLHLPQIFNLPENFAKDAIFEGIAIKMNLSPVNISIFSKENPSEEIKGKNNIPEEKQLNYLDENKAADYFGLIKEQDIAYIKPATAPDNLNNHDIAINIQEIPEKMELNEEKTDAIPSKTFLILPKIIAFIKKLTSIKKNNLKIDYSKLPKKTKIKTRLILLAAIVIILIALFFFAYLFLFNANVVMNIKPKTLNKTTTLIFSAAPNPPSGIIPSQIISVTEQSTASAKTTGKKQIGNKATGTVTLYSRMTNDISIPQGTVITSPNGLNFVLTSNINIASTSANANAQASTAQADITAQDIGTQYNLPSNTQFTIASYDPSQLDAQNDQPFSGGSMQQITVVSKQDEQTLLQHLPSTLQTQAKNDIAAKLAPGQILLPNFLSQILSNETFSKNVGDQASSITLNASVIYKILAYRQSSVLNFLSKNILNIKSLSLNQNSLNISLSNVQPENNTDEKTNAHITATLIPVINKRALAKQIEGMSITDAKNILLKIPQVSSISISLSPNISFLSRKLPQLPNHINFTIRMND